MFDFTPLARPLLSRYAAADLRAATDPEYFQRALLLRLLSRAANTRWGREHGYGSITSYEQFREHVDITPYDRLRETVMDMVDGKPDLLWPGTTRRFAQSSGTSDGRSKFIPVTGDSLRRSHYRGATSVVSHYLNLYPGSRLFGGRSLILGGSFANGLNLPPGSHARVGDLSANLIEAINPMAEFFRVPGRRLALMADWEKKLPLLAEAAARADITNISGVPSWMHGVLREVLRITGATMLHEVWPRLEVFFHGGISMKPYRALYDSIIDPARMRYLETYNASEGFFAVQDIIESQAMLLLLDAGTFYELARPDGSAPVIPVWEACQGDVYSLIISSCNGLWRYPLGDTVRIESTSPLRITIAGRTRHFINAFGEEVMVHNTDAALSQACRKTGAHALNYTAAPVYTTSRSRGRHEWIIEFDREPADLEDFAETLDLALQNENSDYQAKRAGGIFLDRLTVIKARPGLFDRWLSSTGKLGGQRKVPRLSNDRTIIDRLLRMNNNI